jgi:hypothetical protein
MSEATTLQGSRPDAPPQPLACRLRLKEVSGRRGSLPHWGEVELENVSDAPVEIAYWMTALQYLNLVVTRADGFVVSEGHFGDRFAPTRDPQALRLEPGEKFTTEVPLFATVPGDRLLPGVYAVQAVYGYNDFRAVAEPLRVSVEKVA